MTSRLSKCMSLAMTKRVWEDKSLKNAIDRLVMLALAHCHNSDRGCFPSLQNLERMTQLSRPAICHAIRRLSDAEHIQKIAGGGRGRRTTYYLYPEPHRPLQKTINHVDSLGPVKTVNGADPFSLEKPENCASSKSNRTETASANRRLRFPPPTIEEFITYGLSKGISEQDCRDQFEIWQEAKWHDGHDTPIKNWKAKLFTQAKIGNLPSHKRSKLQSRGPQYNPPGFNPNSFV